MTLSTRPAPQLMPARIAKRLGVTQTEDLRARLARGERVAIRHREVAARHFNNLISEPDQGINFELARHILGKPAEAELGLTDFEALAAKLLDPTQEIRALEDSAVATLAAEKSWTIGSTEHQQLTTDLLELRSALGRGFRCRSVARIPDAARLLPGDSLSPAAGVSFAGQLQFLVDNTAVPCQPGTARENTSQKKVDLSDFLAGVRRITFTETEDLQTRSEKIWQHVLQHGLPLIERVNFVGANTPQEVCAIITKLAFQEAGISTRLVIGKTEITRGPKKLIGGDSQEIRVWVEVETAPNCLLLIDTNRRQLHKNKTRTTLPTFYDQNALINCITNLPDNEVWVYGTSINAVFRPTSYVAAEALEVIHCQATAQDAEKDIAVDELSKKRLFGRTTHGPKIDRKGNPQNQDNAVAATDGSNILLGVLDGISQGIHPEYASFVGSLGLRMAFEEGASALHALQNAGFMVWTANARQGFDTDIRSDGYDRTTTTAVAAIINIATGQASVVHAGDSPAFWVRPDGVWMLTRAHIFAENNSQMIRNTTNDGPLITPFQVGTNNCTENYRTTQADYYAWVRSIGGMGSLLMGYLGLREIERIGKTEITLRPGETLLLCSDGVIRPLDANAFISAVSSPSPGATPTAESAELVITSLFDAIGSWRGDDITALAFNQPTPADLH